MTYTIPESQVMDLQELADEIEASIGGTERPDVPQLLRTLRAALATVQPIPQITAVAHGQVLRNENIDYSDAERLGKVVVEYRNGPRDYGIQIVVSDFEFQKASSCRDTVTKGCVWARDALAAAIEVDRLAPGGTMIIAAD